MTYYLNQVRNLQKQAQLSYKLTQAKLAQSRIYQQNLKKSLYNKKTSRKDEDKQTGIFLQRSRLQSQLQATKVSTNAILTRSRVQSALNLRQANTQLYKQKQSALIQQHLAYNRQCQLQLQLYKQKQIQRQKQYQIQRELQQLQMMKRKQMEDEMVHRKYLEEEQYRREKEQLERRVYEQKKRMGLYDYLYYM